MLGLELGADDYIMKPFDSKEMVEKCVPFCVVISLPNQKYLLQKKQNVWNTTDLPSNLTNYSVLCDGQNIDMPPKELELLYFLAASPNQVFTREQLLDRSGGMDTIGDTRTVDVHIKRLREKIQRSSGMGTQHCMGNRLQI